MKEETWNYLSRELSKNVVKMSEQLYKIQKKWLNPDVKKPRVTYAEVPEKEVSERFLARAEKILEFCNRTLKLKDVNIDWIEFMGISDDYPGRKIIQRDDLYFGWADLKGNKVVIRHDVPLKDMEITLAHELHHLWFRKKYGKEYSYDEETYMWEQTADRFAEKVLREIWDKEHQDVTWPVTFLGGK